MTKLPCPERTPAQGGCPIHHRHATGCGDCISAWEASRKTPAQVAEDCEREAHEALRNAQRAAFREETNLADIAEFAAHTAISRAIAAARWAQADRDLVIALNALPVSVGVTRKHLTVDGEDAMVAERDRLRREYEEGR